MKRERNNGFSLMELLVAVSVIMILAALAVPRLINQVYAIRIRYAATDLSGLLQSARIEGVRRNSFFSVQPLAGSVPAIEEVVDKNGVAVNTIPKSTMPSNVTVFFGPGSGAPAENVLTTTLNFNPVAANAGLPSFNSRGLPCIPAGGTTCPALAGQGFVFFLSRTSSTGGSSGWTAVAVTPSGRCQVWIYDGNNWTQL
jgi:prepilin-type N-terminal cleavage/methylation domain-containing protein